MENRDIKLSTFLDSEVDKDYLHISIKVRKRRITIVSTRGSKGNPLIALAVIQIAYGLLFVERQLYAVINMAAKPTLV